MIILIVIVCYYCYLTSIHKLDIVQLIITKHTHTHMNIFWTTSRVLFVIKMRHDS